VLRFQFGNDSVEVTVRLKILRQEWRAGLSSVHKYLYLPPLPPQLIRRSFFYTSRSIPLLALHFAALKCRLRPAAPPSPLVKMT
jgi:hypothetical protein